MRFRALGCLIRSSYSFSLVFFVLIGCEKASNESPLEKKGRAVYQSACTACHNSNPKIDGSVGPAVFGSSLELLEARVVKGTYPEGTTPKRPTHLMVAMPQYANDIPALHAYLNSSQ